MLHQVEIRVEPVNLCMGELHRDLVAKRLKVDVSRITYLNLQKRSIDARGSRVLYVLRFQVGLDGQSVDKQDFRLKLKNVSKAKPIIIVGSGPAGLFAALRLIERGLKPVILERGKEVRERRKDIALVSKKGVVDPNSNYCFGEGGAGTFSDGKLYTRSLKRGSLNRILNIFVEFGASNEILIDAHPHIGTNKLPQIISAMREAIISCGGEFYFSQTVNDLLVSNAKVCGAKTENGNKFEAGAVVLATGHSARNIYSMVGRLGCRLEAKPFALGVRVEHPQNLIDQFQYKNSCRDFLPAASYSLRSQVSGRGVFSFCMCPGGIICPAATDKGEVVVNGWSPSKRNSKFANSGIVVEISSDDLLKFSDDPVWAGLELQKFVERSAFEMGGGNLVAPAQRLGDFVKGKLSNDLPECSYNPGVTSSDVSQVFPKEISARLKEGFIEFEKKRSGILTNDAVVVATESRTSSPVKIPRCEQTLVNLDFEGLYPCGEGAGYAGGIVSAAIDGERVAEAIQLD